MAIFMVFLSILSEGNDEKLITQLTSKSFKEREMAQDCLAMKLKMKMGFELYLKLRTKKLVPVDLEQEKRIGRLLEEYKDGLHARYKLDLQGYGSWPQIDEGLPSDYKWQRMDRTEVIRHYWQRAYCSRDLPCHPHHPRLRRACELWMNERMSLVFQQALGKATTEKELRGAIIERMNPIQKDLDRLIAGDKQWYLKIRFKNPYCDEMPRLGD